MQNFNPRSDERSDPLQNAHSKAILYFNPRSDERSDISKFVNVEVSRISIHAPTNGATYLYRYLYILVTFQSTLRRTERPVSSAVSSAVSSISIHAPTNGATSCVYRTLIAYLISIHAPTNGATYQNITVDVSLLISIHAPTNGAT